MPINEVLFFGETGNLYPLDVRHSPQQRADFDPIPGGKIRIRVQTEPGFKDVFVVYNDGNPKAEKLNLWAETLRIQYWQGEIQPDASQFHYQIALQHQDGSAVYHGPTGTTGASEFHFQIDLNKETVLTTPKWMHGAIIYQIFPERFHNGDPNLNPPGTEPWGSKPTSSQFQGGDLRGILKKLDYLEELGVEVLYLNPIFTSPSNHKYACSDYYNVDPSFGGNEALHDLISQLHKRSLKIILDASFNHCHPNFMGFRDVKINGPESKYWDWFTIYEYPLTVKVRPHLLPPEHKERTEHYQSWLSKFEQDTGIPVYIAEDEGPILTPSYDAWMGVPTMPKINLSNPETRAYFLDVTRYWIEEFKIDGWRMDVVPHIVPNFWADFRETAKASNPDVMLLAEIWGNASYWLQGDGFDGTMNYTIRSLALEYFARNKMDTQTFLDGCKHMLMMYAPEMTLVNQNLLSSHDTERFLHEAGEDNSRLRLATLFQMTIPGAPSIYYGDEIGMTGGHDPDCRRAFPWESDSWDLEMHSLVKTLAKLRKEYPALRTGDWEAIWQSDEALAYRRSEKNQQILVVISRNKSISDVHLPLQNKELALLYGDVEFDTTRNGLTIHKQAPWTGSIYLIHP